MIFRDAAPPSWLKAVLDDPTQTATLYDADGKPILTVPRSEMAGLFGYGDATGTSTAAQVTGPTAADMLMQQLIVHGAGTSTILQADTPITGNMQAQLLAQSQGVALPPNKTLVKTTAGGGYFIVNGRRQTIDFPDQVPDCGCVTGYPDNVIQAMMPDVVSYMVSANGYHPVGLVFPPDAWIQSYITANKALPNDDAGGCAIAWTPAQLAKWQALVPAAPAAPPPPPPTVVTPPPTPPTPPNNPGPNNPNHPVVNGYGFRGFADVIWTVKAGDTLSQIAETVGICVKGPGNTDADWADCVAAAQRIADANGLTDVNSIQVGQQLVVPVPVTVAADGTATVAPLAAGGSSPLLWAAALGLGAFFMFRGKQAAPTQRKVKISRKKRRK